MGIIRSGLLFKEGVSLPVFCDTIVCYNNRLLPCLVRKTKGS